jgi:hypothetical protein
MTQVYRLDRMPAHRNHHEVDVDETLAIVPDEYFNSLEEAESYVIEMNIKTCGQTLGITYDSNDENLITEKCLSTEWCHKQRYFVTRPSIKLLRNNLEKEGATTYGVSASKITVSYTGRKLIYENVSKL